MNLCLSHPRKKTYLETLLTDFITQSLKIVISDKKPSVGLQVNKKNLYVIKRMLNVYHDLAIVLLISALQPGTSQY